MFLDQRAQLNFTLGCSEIFSQNMTSGYRVSLKIAVPIQAEAL